MVTVAKRKNASSIIRILYIRTTTETIELTGWVPTTKNLYFEKKKQIKFALRFVDYLP